MQIKFRFSLAFKEPQSLKLQRYWYCKRHATGEMALHKHCSFNTFLIWDMHFSGGCQTQLQDAMKIRVRLMVQLATKPTIAGLLITGRREEKIIYTLILLSSHSQGCEASFDLPCAMGHRFNTTHINTGDR